MSKNITEYPYISIGWAFLCDYAEFVRDNFDGEGDSDADALATAIEAASQDELSAIDRCIADRLGEDKEYSYAVLLAAEDALGCRRDGKRA